MKKKKKKKGKTLMFFLQFRTKRISFKFKNETSQRVGSYSWYITLFVFCL